MPIENDTTSSPDELLTAALQFGPNGGKNFTGALKTHEVMYSHWSIERHGSWIDATRHTPANMYHRPPVIVFMSDGEDDVSEEAIYDICGSAVRQGYVCLDPEHYYSMGLTPHTTPRGGRFRSTRFSLDRFLQHPRCVGWRR